jgi:HemK-like putative methylase
LDLCAGSGAIGISLLREFSKAKAVFSDLSEEALAVVDENLRTYGLEGRAKVIKANLFDGLGDDCFDVIMSNPPYFATKDWQEVEEEVLKEPRMAFEAGSDGLSFYRSIVSESSKHLNDQGWLYLEVGKGQAEQVATMIEKSFLKLTGIFKDYQKIERIIVARKM